MKKFLLPILLFLMFIPLYVNAETCDTDKITISSITVENKSDNVEELEKATASGKNINLNLSMSEVGDNIEYKFVVKNDSDEDYELDKTSLNLNSDYINYSFETEDNSNVVKSNSSKNVTLRVEYKTEVPEDKFERGSYSDNKTMIVQLSNGKTINVPDTFKNPNTGVQSYILILFLILLISGSIYMLLRKKRYTKFMILIIGIAVIIPISVYAICKCEISVESKVIINSAKYNPCFFDGELQPGVTYINGQYTYKYKQRIFCPDGCFYEDLSEDGWGVFLSKDVSWNDESITSKLCSSINGKPIVSARSMFENNYPKMIDLNNSDTSNISDMVSMFYGLNIPLDLSNFDTSSATDMSIMFAWSYISHLDLSSFDTSNVTNMSYMFSGSQATTIDLSSFNTKNVANMEGMFQNSRVKIIDLSSFDMSNVIKMDNMFKNCEATIGYARNQEDADLLNSSTNKPSTLTFIVKDN